MIEMFAWLATVITLGISAGTVAVVIYMFIIPPPDDNEYLH